VALIVINFCHLMMILFCGLIGTKSIPNWVSSTEWINGFRYSFNLLAMNEFRNITFCIPNLPDICPITGLTLMRKKSLDYATEWDIWKNFFLLTMLTITLFLLAHVQLCRIKTTKRHYTNFFYQIVLFFLCKDRNNPIVEIKKS
jgi:hypothetical protein